MLMGENTKRLGGITIYGDYWDLHNLYDTIADVLKAPVFTEDDLILNAFLYDIRHAFQGQRLQHIFYKDDDLRKVEYFGVTILWPMFIFSVAYIRWGLSFIDNSKKHQADAYRLEEIAHSLLIKADPSIGLTCIDWLKSFPGFPKDYLVQFFNECTFRYLSFSDKPKKRFSNLPQILYMTSPLSEEYTAFNNQLTQTAKENGCSPHELKSFREWPNFKI